MAAVLTLRYNTHWTVGREAFRGRVIDHLCDHDAGLVDQAWGGVRVEPVVLRAHEQQDRPELRPDWMALGAWESGRAAFLMNA